MRREFSAYTKAQAALRANGRCEECTARLGDGGFHYDHIIPDAIGGEPTLENCQVLCLTCHRAKTTKRDIPRAAKTKRQHRGHVNARASKRRWYPDDIKIKVGGRPVDRNTGEPIARRNTQ